MYGCCFTVSAGSIALTHADTHASLVSKKGVPIEVVSKRLGHADIRVTSERYLHVYRDRDAAAASAAAAWRQAQPTQHLLRVRALDDDA
jgi:hypothetical protein